jgi:uncharacterized protein (TIGR03437 family)
MKFAALFLLPAAAAFCANFQATFGSARITASALDAAGNIYIAGTTTSVNIPVTPGAFQQTFQPATCGYIGSQGQLPIPCAHGFVAKLDPAGAKIIWATYLGGTLSDTPAAICAGANGNVFVTGNASSPDFPVTSGAWFTSPGAEVFNGFIAQISTDGSRLIYSTYLPGATGAAIAVDASGSAFVAGQALGTTFPASPGAFQTQRFIANSDAFVVKLNASGSGPIYATLLGGTFGDSANALAVDAHGDAFVAGYTASIPAWQSLAGSSFVPFPTTPGAFYQPGRQASVFIAALNPSGSALTYSSVFGGSGDDSIGALALDGSGIAYFTGYTYSQDWPLTPGALRSKYGNGMAGALSADGTHLVYSTFLAGAGFAIAVDGSGRALLAGSTHKPDLAATPSALAFCAPPLAPGSWQFVMALSPAGAAVYASYLEAWPIALTSAGTIYTESQTAIFDLADVFALAAPGVRCVANAANYASAAIAPGEIVSVFGPGIGPAQSSGAVFDAAGNVTSKIGNTRVLIGGIAAPLLYVSANQINAVVPFEIASQTTTTVQIETAGSVMLPSFSAPVAQAAPGIFTADGSGYGQAAALNQDGSLNSASNPAAQGSIVTLFATGLGPMKPQPADGVVPKAPTAEPTLLLVLNIDPLNALIQYAGDAPGLVEGAVQINAVVPQIYTTGAVVVTLAMGGKFGSNTGVFIFVK